MPTILLLVLSSVLILLMALALARELRLRRSYERLLSQILNWRRSRDAPMDEGLVPDTAAGSDRVQGGRTDGPDGRPDRRNAA